MEKVSKEAWNWAEKAYRARPATFLFTRVPINCQRMRCGGFHETISVSVTKEGKVYTELTYGYHASVYGARQVYQGQGVEALAKTAYGLMRWARQVDPWAKYPEFGERFVDELETEEIWL